MGLVEVNNEYDVCNVYRQRDAKECIVCVLRRKVGDLRPRLGSISKKQVLRAG